ncbi:MAG: hypothetical protein Q9222_003653 [Ikaeria aurantiellina]
MPDDLWTAVGTDKIQKILCLAMSDYSDGEIFLVYEDSNGTKWSWTNTTMKNASKSLVADMEAQGETQCRMVFGPDGKYCAWKANGNWTRSLTEDYKDVGETMDQMSALAVVSLGVDCAYFFLKKDGKFWYNLRGNYDALQEIMVDLRAGDIEFLAINPFRVGEFFLLLANNTAVFQVPLAHRSQLEDALAKHGISCRALTSQQTEDSASVPERARSRGFAKGLLRSVAGNTFGGVISGVASALFGAASCAVMIAPTLITPVEKAKISSPCLVADFLRLSRATIDDSIIQNLNALVTPARAGFDPSSTAERQIQPTRKRPIDSEACQSFKENVLFQSWQTRSDVLNYCAGVALDPEDPDLVSRQVESAKERERVVDERLDPYSGRFFPREARTESLANLIRNERGVEGIIRIRSWGLVNERCGDTAVGWEEALNRWRASQESLKSANQILNKSPSHGDTQAMKALIINAQGNTDEAFALCKIALKNAMKSHVCWHVYGLLWRCIKNYEEAIKAYKFALKLEPDSQQILRDLALLQMQMRDYQGYIQSRRIILQTKSALRQNNSTLRQNWTALAMAQHLAGDLYDAERTLTTFEETLRSAPSKSDNEHSEAVLYKNTIIAEMGETERALDHLEAVFKNNLDRTAVMEMRAQYLLQLDRKQEAEKTYRALLDRNPNYGAYYEGLRKAMAIAESDTKPLRLLYDEYARKDPRCDIAKRAPLDFLQGDEFRAAADPYLQQMLHKGIPSTFANIKALYPDSSKRDTIQKLVEGYLTGKHTPLANGTSDKQVNGDETTEKKKSTFDVSVLYFLAQHYNYHVSRDLEKSMDLIDRAIEAQPEEVNFHMTKARIWKHLGNSQKASETMEKARSLDERDRYINTKAAKYQLRNHENEAAVATMGKFTRKEAIGGPLGDLIDMQCIWYLTEDGEAYMRQGRLGLALKRFTAVHDIFEIWQEDQFDFHTFSLRKGQIRAYVDMIKWQDHLREHPYFSRAAIFAVKIYIRLFDNPQLANDSNGMNGSLDGMDSSERKKAQRKARKAQEKQEQIDAEKADAKKTASVGADGEIKKEDKDSKGTKLVTTTEPLVDAMKFLTPLLEFSPKNIEAQLIGFEVFLRREKYLLALRCLLAARAIDPFHPSIHVQSIRLAHALKLLPEPPSPKVAEIFETEFSSLIAPDADLMKLNSEFLANNSESAAHVQASLCARQALDAKTADDNQKDVIRTLALPSVSLEDAVRGLDLLRDWKAQSRYRTDYIAAAHERWPEATVFMNKQE